MSNIRGIIILLLSKEAGLQRKPVLLPGEPVMEVLQASIAATCPAAFSGMAGSLFASTIAAVVATQCAIFDDYDWPKDNAQEIIERRNNAVSYDFIVVGAGTAGSLVAGRLAILFSANSVLLVEAGDDPGLDSEVPAFFFANRNQDADWRYEVKPDGKSCLGFNNNTCLWNKGKALGGSSSINAMIYVRGHPEDFDNWDSLGNPGWGYKNLSYYFEMIENEYKLSENKYLDIPWSKLIFEAWKELGLNHHAEGNAEALTGTQITKLLVKKGKRLNTAKSYLATFKNLHIMKRTVVEKILIDSKTQTVKGIVIRHNSGVIMEISVKNEVILSAGSIATPQLLMLSGIGPKAHLENRGIKCLRDLPVGKNLQDHVMVPMFIKTINKQVLSAETRASFLFQYMKTRTGPLSTSGVNIHGYLDTNNLGYPNVQFYHAYYPMKEELFLKSFLVGSNYRDDILRLILNMNNKSDVLGISPTILHPKSTGEVLLASKDSKAKPIIQANYFKHSDDVKTVIDAVKFIRKLENTIAFKKIGAKLVKLDIRDCSNLTKVAYWDCYIRHVGTTIYHPVGTVKMGNDDGTSVVNNDLLVHGIKRLRVVDASVMPNIPGGNTMAATLAIAAKAVDIISNYYKYCKDEL